MLSVDRNGWAIALNMEAAFAPFSTGAAQAGADTSAESAGSACETIEYGDAASGPSWQNRTRILMIGGYGLKSSLNARRAMAVT